MESYCCLHASLFASPGEHAHFRFSRLEEISPIVDFIAAHCPNPRALSQGLSELMVNAVEHGNLGIYYDEKSKLLSNGEWHTEVERRIALSCNLGKYAILDYVSKPDAAVLTIRDQGAGFNWQPFMEFASTRAADLNGRGIAIAKALDIWDIEYQDSGRRVVCRVRA